MEKVDMGVWNGGGGVGAENRVTASGATFVFIMVTVALDFLAFGIIAPVLPNLIIRFEGGNMARAADITGYFWVAWNLMQLLSLANFLYGIFVLPESLPREKRAKSAWHMANPLGSLTLLRSHPELAGLSVVVFLYYLAHQSLQNVWVLYTEYRYGWNTKSVGISLALVGVCAVIVSGGLVGPYVEKFGERFSLASGLFYGYFGFAGFGLAWRGWGALAVVPFIALWGVAGPAMQSLMSKRVDATSQGKLQGAINSLRALTGMAGPLLFTQVFSSAISPGAKVYLPGAAYYLAALILVVALVVAVAVASGAGTRVG